MRMAAARFVLGRAAESVLHGLLAGEVQVVRNLRNALVGITARVAIPPRLVVRALPLLQSIGENLTTLTAITEELTRLEGRVDDLHDIGLSELFQKHRNANAMDFIIGADIYDHLEKVADRFDDVANEINSIVIEQV